MVEIELDQESCMGCEVCVQSCPVGIYSMEGEKAAVTGNVDECTLCRVCEESCPVGAIVVKE